MKNNGFYVSAVGFLGVILTIVAPIIWGWYSSQSNLTLVKISEVKLVEKKASIANLKIIYNNKPIENLTKLSLKLKNSGEKPITESEIIEPIEILFNNIRVLDSSLDKTIPKNINATIKNENNKISILFKLLNPDDELYFSILTDSEKIDFSTKSRIKNIKQINIISLEDEKLIKSNIPWRIYLIGFFAIFFFIMGLHTLFNEVPEGKAKIKLLQSGKTPIKAGCKKDDYYAYINKDLKFLSIEKKKELKKLITKGFISASEVKDVQNEIIEKIDIESTFGAMILIIAISGYGVWYTIQNIFNF